MFDYFTSIYVCINSFTSDAERLRYAVQFLPSLKQLGNFPDEIDNYRMGTDARHLYDLLETRHTQNLNPAQLALLDTIVSSIN